MNPSDLPPQTIMMRLVTGFRVTQMLAVAARLELAERLADGPRSAEELASASGANPDALYRMLRALAPLGVFEALPERRFALTPLGATLRDDHPQSMRAFALFAADTVYRAWGDLEYSVMTGKPAFDHVFGASHFDYLSAHPDDSEQFNQSMSGTVRREIVAMVAAYDFAGVGRVVDVGGGHGALLARILLANPALHGALFDLPHVVTGAEPTLRAANVADRCELVGGDFFSASPPAGDILTLSHIIHDWDDERATTILRNCAAALAPGGKVLLIEDVIEPGANAQQTLFRDMQMLVMTGGRERTAEEFDWLFTSAGLRLSRIIPTEATANIIEGVAAG
ncbi:MAG TPA: methyltransferase [Ktedonobacterales bacterium]